MKINEIDDLLALRGKIFINYDWQWEEKLELEAAQDELTIFQSVERSS